MTPSRVCQTPEETVQTGLSSDSNIVRQVSFSAWGTVALNRPSNVEAVGTANVSTNESVELTAYTVAIDISHTKYIVG